MLEGAGSNPDSADYLVTFHWPGLTWNERLGVPACPYLRRWILDFGGFSIRLYNWLHGDDPRAMHDHAWDFWSLVLAGAIHETNPQGSLTRYPGSLSYFPAEYVHTVQVKRSTWTLLVTGPVRRPRWGFWVGGRFRKRNKFFFEHGHHNPCE